MKTGFSRSLNFRDVNKCLNLKFSSMALPISNTKRKSKAYYKNFSKKNRYGILKTGTKGILITCNGYEKQCVKEAYNLLNEYADNLYGPEFQAFDGKETDLSEEDQLKKELNILKTEKKDRRFHQSGTKVKNILFIESNVPDPCQLVSTIFRDAAETKQKKSRFILKMIPVLITCKCTPEDFKKSLANVIDEKYSESGTVLSYRINCKVRNNSSVDKQDFIWYSRELVGSIRKTWLATLDDPDIIIEINILQSICCISLLDCYEDFKKYNLSVIVPLQSTSTKKRDIECINDSSSKFMKNVEKTDSSQLTHLPSEETNLKNANKNDSSVLKQDTVLVPNDILEADDIDIFSGT